MRSLALLLTAVAACGGSDALPADAGADAYTGPPPGETTAPIDRDFGDDGFTYLMAAALTGLDEVDIDASGRIYAAGWAFDGLGFATVLCRLTADGTLDRSWAGDGCADGVSHDASAAGLVLTNAGPVIAGYVGGECGAVWRYDDTGQLDDTFGDAGMVCIPDVLGTHATAIRSDGDELVVTSREQSPPLDGPLRLARLSSSGTVLDSIDGQVGAVALTLGRHADGRWRVGGFMGFSAFVADVPDDLSQVVVQSTTSSSAVIVYQLDVLDDGRVLVLDDVGVRRELDDGTVDPTFPPLVQPEDEEWLAFTRLRDGRIAIVGGVRGEAWGITPQLPSLRVYSADGVLDESLGMGGLMQIGPTRISYGELRDVMIYGAAEDADGALVTVSHERYDENSHWVMLNRIEL